MYPHLKYLIDDLSSHYEIDLFYSHERGLYIEEIVHRIKHSPLSRSAYRPLCVIIKNIIKLYGINYSRKYDVVVAVDNFLYALTSLIFRDNRVVLFSHDFVGHDTKEAKLPIQICIANATRKILSRNRKIIVQDHDRLDLLMKSIGVEANFSDVFYLPVSLPPPTLPKATNRNFTKLSKTNLPTLMQIGGINAFRSGSDELLKIYQDKFDEFNLWFHGLIFDEIEKMLIEVDVLPFVSSSMVKQDHIPQLIYMCDIGYINYRTQDLNFYYTSYASGQLVEFIRCGKPVIVKGNTNLRQYVERHKIGVAIQEIRDLVPAINLIKNDYENYSRNCIDLFEKTYNLKKYTQKLISFLENN